jgi:dirigent-like protein
MRRTILAAAAAAAITATAMLGPVGAFAAPSQARTTTIQLVAHLTHAVIVDAGASGPSAGDQQVVAGTLTKGSTKAGRFGFICEFLTTGAKADEQCDGTGRLSRGSITVSGFSRQSDTEHTWAVVGGTGVYRDATGQVRIHDVNDTTSDVTIELG